MVVLVSQTDAAARSVHFFVGNVTAELVKRPLATHLVHIFHAHLGWLFSGSDETAWKRVKDLAKFPELVWLEKY